MYVCAQQKHHFAFFFARIEYTPVERNCKEMQFLQKNCRSDELTSAQYSGRVNYTSKRNTI